MKIIIFTLIALIMVACEADFISTYELDKPILIVEGWVTNSGESQRIIVSQSLNEPYQNYEWDKPKGNLVSNATVILSSVSQPADTLTLELSEEGWTGYYISNTIIGVPNETYFLKIEYNGNIYEAEAFMPTVPAIDSITFDRKRVSKENTNLFVPLVNFKDPKHEENHYLFRDVYLSYINDGDSIWKFSRGNDPWMISLFSDKYINGKLAQLNTREGITVKDYWLDGNFHLWPGDQVNIQMQSLTKEAYEFYMALINQLNYAAGVFHPAPASPPTNISNGGQGFFGASAVSRKSVIVPEGDKYDDLKK